MVTPGIIDEVSDLWELMGDLVGFNGILHDLSEHLITGNHGFSRQT